MAYERLLIEEIRRQKTPEFESFKITGGDILLDIITRYLKDMFSMHPIYTFVKRVIDGKYDSYDMDYDLSKIMITQKYTGESFFLPLITVELSSSKLDLIQFNNSQFKTTIKYRMNPDGSFVRDEMGRPIPSHYIYNGKIESEINLIIAASSTIERDELCNFISLLLIDIANDELFKKGVFVIPNTINISSPDETEYNNNYIYKQTISFSVYSEWSHIIPIDLYTLRSISVWTTAYDRIIKNNNISIPIPTVKIIDDNDMNFLLDVNNNSKINKYPIFALSANDEYVEVTNKYLHEETFFVPSAFLFNKDDNKWHVNEFWINTLKNINIDFNEQIKQLNKKDPYTTWKEIINKIILLVYEIRYLILTGSGREMIDGTIVINNNFYYPDETIEIRTPTEYYYKAIITKDNIVNIYRFKDNNDYILIGKDIILDDDFNISSIKIIKKYKNNIEKEIEKRENVFIKIIQNDIDNITPQELSMILLFGIYPFKVTFTNYLYWIDKVINETITTPIQPITDELIKIKKDVLYLSEKYLLAKPIES